MAMAWRDYYLDVALIPLGLFFPTAYHLWLWHTISHHPLRTTIGIDTATRRLWIFSMKKSNESRAAVVEAVQALRNVIMGSTLVATTSILFCTGAAAMLSGTNAAAVLLGTHGDGAEALKYAVLMLIFLLTFLCHSLSICSTNQAALLAVSLPAAHAASMPRLPVVMEDYVADVLERGYLLSLAGNRLFYTGVLLLLWIFGPVLPCICSMVMVPVLYRIDMAACSEKGNCNGEGYGNKVMDVGDDDQSPQV